MSISLGDSSGGTAFLCLWEMPPDVYATITRTERGCVVLVATHVIGAAYEREVSRWAREHFYEMGFRAYVAA